MSFLLTLRDLLADLLFPPRCVGCRQPGPELCERCLATLARFPEPRCPRCDLPTPLPRCAACQRGQFPALAGMRVIGPHTDPLQAAIHALKYNRRRALAQPLGDLLAAHWRHAPGAPLDALLPVPLHPARLQERGFNQSALLAEAMAPHLALPVRTDLLQRTRATRPQVGLGRQERLHNVADAFSALPDAAGGSWLLVDDVCTTGATLQACAAALHAQGAPTVWAITLARPPT